MTADSTVKALLLRVACEHLVSGRILKTANPMAIVEVSRRTNDGPVREYNIGLHRDKLWLGGKYWQVRAILRKSTL